MVKPRKSKELKLMRASGRITATVLRKVLENIKVGTTGLDLDRIAEEEIKRLGGEASFKTVKGYKWTTCITFLNQVVHGIPTDRKIVEGDIISVDLGAVFGGWHTDAAWSVLVGDRKSKIGSRKMQFLKIGEEALWLGIGQAVGGNRVGDISSAIQTHIEAAGYSVVRSLVGHGVGKSLHEEPEVPGYGKKGTGMVLAQGQTLAIEVIYTAGKPDVVVERDGWTISSADGSISGLFEMSVIVGKEKAEVLTLEKIP